MFEPPNKSKNADASHERSFMSGTMRSMRASLALLVCIGLLVGGRAKPARAAISGKTWTCIILCGGAVAYYLTKLSIDNGKADSQGNAADAILDNDWIPEETAPTGVGKSGTSLRALRVDVINAAYNAQNALSGDTDNDKKLRAQFESFRTCWNSFVYAGPPKKTGTEPSPAPSEKPTEKPSAKPSDKPKSPATPKPKKSPPPKHAPPLTTVAMGSELLVSDGASSAPPNGASPSAVPSPTPTPPPSASGCTTNAYAVIKKHDPFPTPSNPLVDPTDLETAFSTGSSLYDQIVNLNIGSNVDFDAMRAEYIEYLATDMRDALRGSAAGAAGGGSPDLTAALSNCGITGLNTINCIETIGSVEAAYAADRRKAVACDVAMRGQLPMLTTIKRVLGALPSHQIAITYTVSTKNGKNIQNNVEQPLEGPSFNFDAAPGC